MSGFNWGMASSRARPARMLSCKRTKGSAWDWMIVIAATGAG